MFRAIYHPFDPEKNQYFIDGNPVSKASFEAFSRLDFAFAPDGHRPGCWPMVSDSLSLHPDQIPDAQAAARKVGVPTAFTTDGQPIFTSAGHKRDYCRKVELELSGRGAYDRNGGYSDP